MFAVRGAGLRAILYNPAALRSFMAICAVARAAKLQELLRREAERCQEAHKVEGDV